MGKQRRLKRRIKVSTKLEIVEQLAHRSSRQVAKDYGVEAELRKVKGDACRLPGGGAKIVGEELHQELTEKVLFERSTQRRVTREPSLRGTRSNCQRYNLDETAVFFDHAKSTTMHTREAKDVPIRSFGFEKQRVTAVFCANAVEEKKLPSVMVKKAPVSGQPSVAFDNGVMELRMGTSWMNSAAFIEYTKCLFPDPLVPHSTLLIFDSARYHTAKDVQDYLEQRGILHAIISGGMMGFYQPADFRWFAQLKNHLARVIDCWKRDGPHQLTGGGRMKPPSSVVVARWLTEAWNVVQPTTIRTSFTRCALGADNQLHLCRHERLGALFAQNIEANSNEQLPEGIQGFLDEFDDFLVVD